MQKIIREILVLLWKVFRLLLWKWLKPILGRIAFYTVVLLSVLAVLVLIATRG